MLYTGGFAWLTDGLQLVVALALITLAALIASNSVRKLFDADNAETAADN